ncbi:LysR family transcriptional regulator [Aurantimonas coralicida]|uniref:LysR family transcriptional regulator n=1 Tax=Aurantimonas coralicida TaxID=182270 RepID=UPI001E33A014|nr:LysR family transcriptional regulator [Aurantimonas coralicida]
MLLHFSGISLRKNRIPCSWGKLGRNALMREIPPLRAIQAFESAARLGSFQGAAEELRVTPSAISHQIRALEKEIGAALFHRTNRRIVLTDVGRRYAAEVGATSRISAPCTQKTLQVRF